MKLSIKGQGHSFTLVKVHSDFKVKCLTFGLYTQVSDSGPLGPLVLCYHILLGITVYLQVICNLEGVCISVIGQLSAYPTHVSEKKYWGMTIPVLTINGIINTLHKWPSYSLSILLELHVTISKAINSLTTEKQMTKC